VGDWAWISASCKGTSHVRSGVSLQDAVTCFYASEQSTEFIAAIVSDGAGSAVKGGAGAALVCRNLRSTIKSHFAQHSNLPSDETIASWIDQIRDLIFHVAEKWSLTPRDFAATLVLAISDGRNTVVVHIGDGCAVVKNGVSNEWIAPVWPEQGAYASTTFFITDEVQQQLRIVRLNEPIMGLALFSDGLERLALDFAAKRAVPQFFEAFANPVKTSDISGKNQNLSQQLKKFLDSDRVNARTDDDKSFILALKR
jgi:Protein phosphatase 2C